MSKIALITGITGQDGSYLAEYLLSKGYEVHGIIRRSSSFNTQRIAHIFQEFYDPNRKLTLHYGDLSESSSIGNLIIKIRPDEVYNLAAQSHVRVSFDLPVYTGMITGLSTTGVLDTIKGLDYKCKFYQASSSELFGSTTPPQNEDSPFQPRSPYAVAKLYSYWITKNYREAYDMFASNGILFNHESPRRGKTFVTRKITYHLAKILAKELKHIYLGNLDAKRDWGYAPEYVIGMWKMLQHDKPGDFVLGTGQSNSIKEFLEAAFSYVGLNYEDYVKIDKRYLRPTEVDFLQADITKAKTVLKWEPRVKFNDLVKIMVDYDLKAFGLEYPGEGIEFLSKNDLLWTPSTETLG